MHDEGTVYFLRECFVYHLLYLTISAQRNCNDLRDSRIVESSWCSKENTQWFSCKYKGVWVV